MSKQHPPIHPGIDDHFGLCPHCLNTDGFINIGRDHYGLCESHLVYWPIGSNLFSSWQHETEDDWERNRRLLDTFERIKPGYLPETVANIKAREESQWRVKALFNMLDESKQATVMKLLCDLTGMDAVDSGFKSRACQGDGLPF